MFEKFFQKLARGIYNGLKGKMRLSSTDKVREYIRALERCKDVENALEEYYVKKISTVLLILAAGIFLSLMMFISSGNGKNLREDGTIERNPFGGREFEVHLTAMDNQGQEIGDFDVPINTQKFTPKEAEELFNEASGQLEEVILGENESLDRVTCDLNLVEMMEGYPFDITWKMDEYEVLHMDGKINKESMPLEGAAVTLTATFKYEEQTWEQSFVANISKEALSPTERAVRQINELIAKKDKESATEDKLTLPTNNEGTEIVWNEKVENNSLLMLALAVAAAVAVFVLKDKELKKSMDLRNRQMLSDYPQMVSQLVLYMEAGMTMRNIFGKLGAVYSREKKAGAGQRYLYEEILMTVRELSLGTSEAAAYEHFGLRCGGQQYAKLSTLLSQNLKKGNSELLTLLQEESKRAFSERMDNVRKAGEEAGTKLLTPMVIMLVIVMAVVMIPAYLAF